MKVTSFHFMPDRERPDVPARRCRSRWVDAPRSQVADAVPAGEAGGR